ncbi:MAG: sugar phosphate isomerase/epimerase [Candidatus Marsarchaeota archaeon]
MHRINMAWLYAITKYGYPPPLPDVFRTIDDAVRLGFRALELEVYGESNLREFQREKGKIREEIEARGLKVVNVAGVFRELISPDEREREKALSMFRETCELADFFGSPMVQTDTFTPPVQFVGKKPYSESVSFAEAYDVVVPEDFSWVSFWNSLVNVMKSCSKAAADHGLLFAIEPRVGETVSNTDAMLSLMREVGEDNFGAVLDTGHLHAAKELLPLSVEKLGKKIYYVHLSDNDGRDNFHRAPGKGTISWDGVFRGLRKFGFSGYVAIDIGGKDVTDLDKEVTEGRLFAERMYEQYLSQ